MDSCSSSTATATYTSPATAGAPTTATTTTEEEVIITGALSSLLPSRFTSLSLALSADLGLRHHRLLFLLVSPSHFAETITYLHSLSLFKKTLLLARLLLRSLQHLLLPLTDCPSSSSPMLLFPTRSHRLLPHDLDAAVLLLAMCESYKPNSTNSDDDRDNNNTSFAFDWKTCIANHILKTCLSPSGLGGTIALYIEDAARCKRLLNAVRRDEIGTDHDEKETKCAAASVAAVVELPSVLWKVEGECCAICGEVLMDCDGGRDVCEMPCKHGFHWACIVPWLRRRNTCPCCRFELCTDDVFCEIDRLWRAAIKLYGVGCRDGNDD